MWAAGVTYLRSREARRAESTAASMYDLVYEAARPELFFKAQGWRVVGHGAPVRIRRDSHWNVPEPELVLVINRFREIVGYSAGNDMSSRDIEGENPLYLPQAKVYNGSCAVGPGIILADDSQMISLPIGLTILRQGKPVFQGETSSARMKRSLPELAACLGRELDFPHGALLMTGTGIVPGDDFTLQPGDRVHVQVGRPHVGKRSPGFNAFFDGAPSKKRIKINSFPLAEIPMRQQIAQLVAAVNVKLFENMVSIALDRAVRDR